MTQQVLANWQSREIAHIDSALNQIVEELPLPCRPIAAHILLSGGKRLRPLLALACAQLFTPHDRKLYPLVCSLELLHVATLLHDDILDNASTRRNQPTAQTIYGSTATILAGDALLAYGNTIVASWQNPDLVNCYSAATMGAACGEILEMSALRNPELTHEAYLEIAAGKTGCLIAQSCLLGAIAAKAAPNYQQACLEFGENLGIAFQIIDDALDFLPRESTGKPTGGDLREGKMTPPVSLYRATLAEHERHEFDRKFRDNLFTEPELEETCASIAGFIPQARKVADECLANARQSLCELPQNGAHGILEQMVDYVASRHH